MKDLEDIGSIIDSVVDKLDLKKKLKVSDVFNHWEDIVGVEIAKKAKPNTLVRKTLYVSVTTSTWANELSLMSEKLVEKICEESTSIANADGEDLSYRDTIKKTKKVIKNTAENYSSMLQSFKKGKKTEIRSINGTLVNIGRKYGIDTSLNRALVYLVKSMSEQ